MKDYDTNKELSYLQYWDVSNLYGRLMSQKLPVNNFEWIEDTSQSNEDFIKNYNEQSDEGYFPEVNCSISCKKTWSIQWFTFSAWKNQDWKSRRACS